MRAVASTAALSHQPPSVVAWFAGFGAAVLAVAVWSMGSWILSADFRPTPIDPTEPGPPRHTIAFMRVFEAACVIGALAVARHCWITSRREGRLSLPAIIAIAWGLQYWQDPMIQWIRPMFFYNAHFINMGNWSGHIPGWINPTSHGYPSPLLFQGFMYPFLPLILSMAIAWCMRKAKQARPDWGVTQLILVAFGVAVVYDIVMELCFVRTGMYAYPNAVHALTVWAGKPYQFPLYEAFFWGMVSSSTAILYYFRDDRGLTVIDRGIERVRSVRWRSPIRVLAMFGFVTVPFSVYNVFMILFSLHGDPTPDYPGWLRNGACGPGTVYECPAPDAVIPPFTRAS
ncbi:MAG TPA: spirocyclase AveC family protein [Nevskiaceae bacterium]|nr:spirocyclase AveC family protein [Nevskiaceae bacterium]